ncbi:MAG: hypothetical protein RSB34_06665 [Muribaculaceae bacterium]
MGLNFRTLVLKWNVFDVLVPRRTKPYRAMKKSVSICVICGETNHRHIKYQWSLRTDSSASAITRSGTSSTFLFRARTMNLL